MRLLGTHLHRRLLCVAAVVDAIPHSARNGLAEGNPDALLADGLERAFIGYGAQYTKPPLAIYDTEKCLEVLMEDNGWTYTEALEYFEFNTACAWMGEGTPIFMTPRIEEEG